MVKPKKITNEMLMKELLALKAENKALKAKLAKKDIKTKATKKKSSKLKLEPKEPKVEAEDKAENKKHPHKTYKSEEIRNITELRRLRPDLSVKKISESLGIPVSTIKTWLKNPDLSRQKAQIREVKKGVSKVDKEKLRKLEKKLIIKSKEGKMGKLQILNTDGSLSYTSG
jgi:hypothetical protein